MATVTGMTTAGIDALTDQLVASLHISGGQLIYTKKSGAEVNIGAIGSTAADGAAAAWPVGSVFISTVPGNPNALMGFGTWVRHGQGRVLVSQDGSDPDFDVVDEVGGVKSVTLTAAQSGMPAHHHHYSGTTDASKVNPNFNDTDATSNPAQAAAVDRGSQVSSTPLEMIGSSHTHTYAGDTDDAAAFGASQSHTNLQPYVVVYMWKRTA